MTLGRFVQPGSPDHKALLLNNRACSLCREGKFLEAEPLFRQALEIWQEHFGRECAPVVACRQSLGSVCAALGDFDGAIVHLREAVEVMAILPNVDPAEEAAYRSILERIETGQPSILEAAKIHARRMWVR